MDRDIEHLFERYQRLVEQALADAPDLDGLADLFAPAFVGASPAGIASGENDSAFRKAMKDGYAQYRAIGTKTMRIRDVRVTPIDAHHHLARVSWTATYRQEGKPEVSVDFDVHYFLQKLDGSPRIFGWVAGDEQALLKEHGLI